MPAKQLSADNLRPAAQQPTHIGTATDFIGWSQDGKHFVVSVRTNTAWPYWEAGSANYELIRIHDTLTGKLLLSFQKAIDFHAGIGEPGVGDPTGDAQNTKLWKQGLLLSEWSTWNKANPLVSATTSRLASGGWRLDTSLVGGSLAQGDQLTIHPEEGYWPKTWSKHRGLHGTKILWEILKGPNKPGRSPQVAVQLVKGTKNVPLLTYTLPFRQRDFYEELGASRKIRARSVIEHFYSPDKQHVLVVVNSALGVANDAFPEPVSEYFLRSLPLALAP